MPAAFTRDELRTLMAVFDTAIPAMPIEELLKLAPSLVDEVDIDLVAEFAAQTPSQLPKVREELLTLIPAVAKPAQIAELKLVLKLMRYARTFISI